MDEYSCIYCGKQGGWDEAPSSRLSLIILFSDTNLFFASKQSTQIHLLPIFNHHISHFHYFLTTFDYLLLQSCNAGVSKCFEVGIRLSKAGDIKKFIEGQNIIILMRVTGDMLSSSQQNSSSHGLDLKSLLTMLEVCIVSYRASFFYSDLWPKHTMTFHNLHYRQQTGFVRCLLNLWAQMEEEDFNSN